MFKCFPILLLSLISLVVSAQISTENDRSAPIMSKERPKSVDLINNSPKKKEDFLSQSIWPNPTKFANLKPHESR